MLMYDLLVAGGPVNIERFHNRLPWAWQFSAIGRMERESHLNYRDITDVGPRHADWLDMWAYLEEIYAEWFHDPHDALLEYLDEVEMAPRTPPRAE